MNSPLIFLPGDEVGTIVCLNITIIDDSGTVEPEQTFLVVANSSDPVIISPISEMTVSIIDDDSKAKLIMQL